MLLYTVRCSPSTFTRQTIFFDEKILCFHRRDRYPDTNPACSVRRKTCSRNMANAFYILFSVRRFFVISPLFRCCSRIVYSGLRKQISPGWRVTLLSDFRCPYLLFQIFKFTFVYFFNHTALLMNTFTNC